MEKLNYEVQKTGFINNHHKKKGDVVKMTAAEAKYLVAPYDNRLILQGEKNEEPVPTPQETTDDEAPVFAKRKRSAVEE